MADDVSPEAGETATGANGPAVLRRMNAGAVLTALRRTGPRRIGDLTRQTGLSRPTVSQALALLVDEGLVEYAEDQPDAAGRRRLGRPAAVARFRAENGLVIGVDVGTHKVLAIAADLAGTPLARHRRDTSGVTDRTALLREVRAAVRDVVAAGRLDPTRLRRICVGAPGIVDTAHGRIVKAPTLPGWASMELAAELGETFACPIDVDNDVNLAVIAERSAGVAAGVADLVFVQWGTRVGAGIVIGGRLHRGGRSAAGEIGYLTFGHVARPVLDAPDGLGPFERTVSVAAIEELTRRALERPSAAPLLRRLGGDPRRFVAADVFAAANDADPTAIEVVDRLAARFAKGLAALLLVLDPELVVIGGGVSQAGPLLLERIRRHIATRTLVPPRLALSTLGDESVALGAVQLALEHIELLPRA